LIGLLSNALLLAGLPTCQKFRVSRPRAACSNFLSSNDFDTRRASCGLGRCHCSVSWPKPGERAGYRRVPRRRCNLLYMTGAVGQQETFGPEAGGSPRPAASSNPLRPAFLGSPICEHFRSLAKQAHRYASIRSTGAGSKQRSRRPLQPDRMKHAAGRRERPPVD